jgi:16S rRNA C1402 N4-methylase RsmH
LTTTTVTLHTDGRTIRATYGGGPYVDLTFGGAAHATEVLNVWDYRAGAPVIDNTPDAVRAALMAWVEDMDADPSWPSWHEDYCANA